MVVTQAGPTFFKLKSAAQYRFYKRLGRPVINVQKGEVLQVVDPHDIAYFRMRPDVMVECNAAGTPLDRIGQSGHLNPGKAKSFKVYGRAAQRQAETPALPPPSAAQIQVNEAKRQALLAKKPVQDGATMTVAAPKTPPVAPRVPTPPVSPLPGPAAGDAISPIEELAADGSTARAVPGIDTRI